MNISEIMILLTTKTIAKCNPSGGIRHISKYSNRHKPAKIIRQEFLDYFIKECNHHHVRSSPVIPFCDPSLAFVNAGMNQFKNIFTGKEEPIYKRVANSQKCVRVGGKHNDLTVVGTDGYHHTFFEMLGNWSFGDYFKAEACTLAWKLLIDVYKIPKDALYVTYFGGDKLMGLEEDMETKEIWQSLGVNSNKILPFGAAENFWEMGDSGPCGPCTEIHYDHTGFNNRPKFVNKGLFDLTELWNIVFIQYVRNINGNITSLHNKHVDTGMGFERLTAILQHKMSNYDTDNFSYLLKAIEKISGKVGKYEEKYGEQDWDNLNTSYRILADHSRMIVACLADGTIPEQNQKLRRIMRKCFSISQKVFQKEKGLLTELSNFIVDNLGSVYPEMERNILEIHQIIDYEEEIYRELRNSAQTEWEKLVKQNSSLKPLDILETPNLIPAYKDIIKTKPEEIDGEVAFKLYDTFGLDVQTIAELSKALNLQFDEHNLQKELEKAREKSKKQGVSNTNTLIEDFQKMSLPKTDDSFKYNYKKSDHCYKFDNLQVKVLQIIQDNEIVDKIGPESFCSLLLDRTNFYSEAGGQICDKGSIDFGKTVFEVVEIENLNKYILHKGFLISKIESHLSVGSTGTMKIDEKLRLNLMKNHTATHLLNSVLRSIKGAACQRSSKVTENCLNLDVSIFGTKLTMDEIQEIEYKMNNLISRSLPVEINVVNSQKFLELGEIITIPGEIYPEENIRIIEIKDAGNVISREPCCGTHVFNTEDIEHFCIVKVKSLGRSTASIQAVTGEKSKRALKESHEILKEIAILKNKIPGNIDKTDVLEMAVVSLRNKITSSSAMTIPVLVKQKCLDDLNAISKQIRNIAKGTLNEFIDMEMQSVLDSKVQTTKSNKKYVIHYLRASMIMEKVPLQRATRVCKNMPVMVISYTDNNVHSRCCVPKEFCTDKFTAEKWMKETVAKVFQGSIMIVKGQNEKLICNMRSKRINIQDWDLLLKNSLSAAKEYVENNL